MKEAVWRGASAFALSSALLWANNTKAAPRDEWGAAVVKYGTTMTSAIAASSGPEIMPSPLPPSEERGAIDDTLRAYTAAKTSDDSTITGVQGTANLFIDGTAAVVIGATEGTATLPTILVKGAAQATSDAYFNSLRADSQNQLKAYLATRGQQILKASGLSMTELAGNEDPADIRSRLLQNGALLQDMQNRLPNDPAVRELATGLLVDTLENTSAKELDMLRLHGAKFSKLSQSLQTLGVRLDRLDTDTQNELQDQSDRITTVSNEVDSLNATVSDIDSRMAGNERLTAFVADFAFSKMSAAEKLAAIQSHTFDDEFRCPAASPDCDATKAKSDLIDQLTTESTVDQVRAETGRAISTAADLTTIASNLGITLPPEVGQGVQYAQVAEAAFSQAASGNYIGAVVAVTGLFAHKGPDPTMAFMSAHFERIEGQLQTVLSNQAKLDKKLDAIAQRLELHFAEMNARFDDLDKSIEQIHAEVVGLNTSPWESCNAVYQGITLQAVHYDYDLHARRFRTADGAIQAVYDFDDTIAQCRLTVQKRVFALFKPDWFGNILDVNSVSLVTSKADRDQLVAQRGRVVELLDWFLLTHHMSWVDAINSFQSPAATLADLDSRENPAGRAICQPIAASGILHLWSLVCNEPGPESAVKSLLGVSTVPTFATDVADWSLSVAPIADVYGAYSKGQTLNTSKLLSFAKAQPGAGQGRNILVGAGLTLDYAVASTVLMEGDLTTDAVLTALQAPPITGDTAAEALRLRRKELAADAVRGDATLAANVTLRLLKQRYGIWDFTTKKRTSGTPRPDAYWTSKTRSELDKGGDLFASLRMLFGYDLGFTVSQSGLAAMVLVPAEGNHVDLVVPLPERAALEAGWLRYSKVLGDVMAMRSKVYDRIRDYDIPSQLSSPRLMALTTVLVRSAK